MTNTRLEILGAIKDTLLAVTYGVVIFSIVVQGLTVKFVVKRLVK